MLSEASVNIAAFWITALYSLVFAASIISVISLFALVMEAASISETSVNLY